MTMMSDEFDAEPFHPAMGEAICLACHAHLLSNGEASARDHEQGVFLAAIHGHFVGTTHAIIDKLDLNLLPDVIDVAIAPFLERVSGCLSAAFVDRPFVLPARWMRFNLVRRPIDDINSSSVSPPSRNAGCIVVVRIFDPAIVLIFEFVVFAVGVGIATVPE